MKTMFEFKDKYFISRIGKIPETVLSSPELNELKQKIEQKILGYNAVDDFSLYSYLNL